MPQTLEAETFLSRLAQVPTGPAALLSPVLQPSLDDEAELRRLFATDKTNARLNDIHVGLVDVFDAPDTIRTTRGREVELSEDDLNTEYVMPLSPSQRRSEGAPAMVASLDGFKKNWSIFTENSLLQLLDWDNVIAAGGSVLACLMAIPDSTKKSTKALREYLHKTTFPSSDIDLFLWGLTLEQVYTESTF